MSSPGGSNKRRSLGNQLSVEEQALNIIAKEADTREEKSSAFLAEARKIRSSERENNRKEEYDEDDESNVPSKHAVSPPWPMTSNRIVLEHLNSRDGTLDMHENYKKLMMANVQIDNEKQAATYQVELFKDLLSDRLEEFHEMKERLQKITHERNRLTLDLKEEKARCDKLTSGIMQRDSLIKSSGLSLVTTDGSTTNPLSDIPDITVRNMEAAILTADHLEMLADYTGSLGDRLKQLFEEKLSASAENKKLMKEIESLKSDQLQNVSPSTPLASSSLDETQKNYTESKLKLKRAEQEITTLHGTVTRLETQMLRYKTSAENLEKTEEELKAEKRRLHIELREAKTRIEDLEAKNNIYVKRIEKLKSKNLLENN